MKNKKITGEVVKMCGFTHSNRNLVTIEVCGEENYIANNIKIGSTLKIRKAK